MLYRKWMGAGIPNLKAQGDSESCRSGVFAENILQLSINLVLGRT